MDDEQTPFKKRKLENTTTMEESKAAAAAAGEVLVVPFFGQGHLFPAMELCKNLSSRNYNTTLIIPSHLSSSIPTNFSNHSSLIHVTEISSAAAPAEDDAVPVQGGGPFHHQMQMSEGIKEFLSTRSGDRPTCAVIDIMMSWSKEVFKKFEIPMVSFFTSGATSEAMDYGKWKAKVGDMKPGETRVLPGLPENMPVKFSDLNRGHRGRPNGPPGGLAKPNGYAGPPNGMRFGPDGYAGPPNGMRFGPRGGRGPPQPGQKPRWLDEIEGSVALLINTCDNLERLFIDYIAEQVKLPVWGVGPLLPEKFWESAGSVIHDREIRSNRKSNYTEEEVMQWLETKPEGSVIYISFGSEVGPTMEEYKELAKALEESTHAFIWVIQPGSGKPGPPRSLFEAAQPDTESEEEEGFYPHGLDAKVGNRCLIITGWAPQLLILSHPSTGGFLSHCGWNSTVEALGRGVPLLTWPIRGDQFENSKLVVNHLRVGCMMSAAEDADQSEKLFRKEDIAAGIERIMADEEVHKQAKILSREFGNGFPVSSVKALDAFVEFISQNAA